MAATAWRTYRAAKEYLLTADLDVDSALMRIKIIKTQGAAQVSDYAGITSFASAGSGNPAANMAIKSLGGLDVTTLAGSNTVMFDATDPVFTASGGDATSIQYAVIGISGGKALAWCKLSTATFNVTSGNTLTLTLHANGIFTLHGGET
jgi:hypothetical protein